MIAMPTQTAAEGDAPKGIHGRPHASQEEIVVDIQKLEGMPK